MRSHTTSRFREAFRALPGPDQRQAQAAYRLFANNPRHPSLRFKLIHSTRPIYSARISAEYRALGVRDGEEMIWFWIGTHANYEQLISRL
ncbi:MAG: hypothetical protein ACR2PL_15390 [Dehalococcoidia bacterium]